MAEAGPAPRVRRSELRLRGRKAILYEAGRGDPVVLLGGLGLGGSLWQRTLEALAAAGWRALAPDLPGHGASQAVPGAASPLATADWLVELADRVAVPCAVWLGHSLHAQTVVRMAAAHPRRARAIVLVAPTVGGTRLEAARLLSRLMTDALREPGRVFPRVARHYVRASPGTVLRSWLAAAREDTLDAAGRVRCPALILRGELDPMLPRERLRALAAALRAPVRTLAGNAHALPMSDRAALETSLLGFLGELEREREDDGGPC